MARWTRSRALGTVVVLASLAAVPALLGDYVYDDVRMVGNEAMNDAGDVAEVPFRTSAAYLERDFTTATVGGSTWRPTAMAGLVAVQALAPSPLLHHLVSLALHLATVALLFLAVPRSGTAWWLAVAVFAVHPALGEAWVWINGRADVLAGLGLAALFALAARPPRPHLAALGGLVVAVLGTGAKETFVPGALVLLLVTAIWGPGAFSRAGAASQSRAATGESDELAVQPVTSQTATSQTATRALAIGGFVGIGAALAMRATVVQISGDAARLLNGSMIARLPALFGLGAETLALPLPRPMRSLSYELGVASAPHLVAALLVVIALALLLRARRYPSLALVLGALACLAPTAAVADVFWLGFDRYLYPASVLVLAALAPLIGVHALDRRAIAPSFALVGGCAIALAITATYYVGPTAFANARFERYPDDPSAVLERVGALASSGQTDAALSLLETLPRDLPPSSAHLVARYLYQLDRPNEVVLVLEDVHRRHPNDPFVRYDLLELRGAQARFDEALVLADRLLEEPAFCPAVRQLLQRWERSGRLPADVGVDVQARLGRADCAE